MAPPTILTHKSAFLNAQTLHLSQSLAPSSAWRNSNDRSENSLSERTVDDALYKLNHTMSQHVRRFYALQATRNVAEQIERLFHDVGENAAPDDEGEYGGLAQIEGDLREGVDLTTDSSIAALPPSWDTHRPQEAEARPPEAQRYAELQNSLTTLSTRRGEAKARVERLRHMKALLDPFQKEAVQENLVTRNGEVEKELERMRVLLVRVSGRVAQLPPPHSGETSEQDMVVEDLDEVERNKVQSLLDGF